MLNLFEFTDYKAYLNRAVTERGEIERGVKTRLAASMQCKASYLTRVLSGDSHLSLEQASRASAYFSHQDEECLYFILLVEHARSGTPELRELFDRQIRRQQEQQLSLKKRFQVPEALSEADKITYYGSWTYSAVHVLLDLPDFQTREALARTLKLDSGRLGQVLEFLVRTGLARKQGSRFLPTGQWIHLGKDSPLAPRHHSNWRVRAIDSIERGCEEDLHYTSSITLSMKDRLGARAVLVGALEKIRELVKDTEPERAYTLLIDFFEL